MELRTVIPANVAEYLNGFNRRKYSQFFRQYEELSRPFFDELEASDDAEAHAKELVKQIDDSITGIFKSRKYCDMQFFLMTFTVPAALKRGQRGADFAEALRSEWSARHSDMAFQCADYDTFANGYNNTVFGFKVDWGNKK